MAVPYENYLRVKSLAADGLSAWDIKKIMNDDNKKISINTIYQIMRGDYKLRHEGKNKWLLAGDGKRAAKLELQVEEELERIRKNVISRTTVLEESADVELLKRVIITPKDISSGDLAKIADSAAKRKALAQGQPTDIFKVFEDELSNNDIIELTIDNEPNTREHQNLSTGPEEEGGTEKFSQELQGEQ